MPSLTSRAYEIWANLHSFLKFGIVAVLIAAIGLFSWRPASSVYRNWQIKKDTAAAARALADGEYAEARDLAKDVVRHRQTPEILNILLRAGDALGDPYRAQVALSYLSLKQGAAEDRLFAWEMVCKNASTWTGAAIWSLLPPEEKETTPFILPWVERLLTEGHPEEVSRIILAQNGPFNLQLERYLLDALALKGGTPDYIQLQTRLAKRLQMGEAVDAILLEATDSIPQEQLMPVLSGTAEKWRGMVEPKVISAADQLRLTRFQVADNPSLLEEKLAAALASHETSDRLVLGKWCISLGKDTEAIGVLVPLAKSGDTAAYDLLPGIYLRTRRFVEWNTLLDSPLGITLARVHCDKAKILQEKGEFKEQSLAEQRSFESVNQERSENSMIDLARHAGNLGLGDLARRLWITAISRGKGQIPMSSQFGEMFEYLRFKKEEDNLYSVYTAFRYLEPGNPSVLTEQLYLSCLRGQATPEQALKELDDLHSYTPAVDFRAACAKAVCYLLLGDPSRAVELTGQPVEWASAPLHLRAIRGTALSLHGDAEAAAPFLDKLPWDSLLPSEKRIFGQLLKRKD